jgi:hypothetical protein
MSLMSFQAQYPLIYPCVESKQKLIWRVARPNTFGFNHMLSVSEYESDELLDTMPLGLAKMGLTSFHTQHPWVSHVPSLIDMGLLAC